MTEYIFIVALIAISAIGIVGLVGDNIRGLFGAAADALSGEEEVSAQVARSSDDLIRHKTLREFATKNSAVQAGGAGGP